MLTKTPKFDRVRKDSPALELVDIHKGKSFLVCGTGCSLTSKNREWYEGFDVIIGVNGILGYLIPHYHLFPDLRGKLIFDCETGIKYRYEVKNHSEDQLLKDGRLSKGVSSITHCISLAYMMGAEEINLIGVDAGFSDNGEHYAPGCQIFADSYSDKTLNRMPDFLSGLFGIYEKSGIIVNDYSPNGGLTGCNKLGDKHG